MTEEICGRLLKTVKSNIGMYSGSKPLKYNEKILNLMLEQDQVREVDISKIINLDTMEYLYALHLLALNHVVQDPDAWRRVIAGYDSLTAKRIITDGIAGSEDAVKLGIRLINNPFAADGGGHR